MRGVRRRERGASRAPHAAPPAARAGPPLQALPSARQQSHRFWHSATHPGSEWVPNAAQLTGKTDCRPALHHGTGCRNIPAVAKAKVSSPSHMLTLWLHSLPSCCFNRAVRRHMQVQMSPGGSPRFRKMHARIAVPQSLQLAPDTDAATCPPLPLRHKPSPPWPASSGERGGTKP